MFKLLFWVFRRLFCIFGSHSLIIYTSQPDVLARCENCKNNFRCIFPAEYGNPIWVKIKKVKRENNDSTRIV